MCTVTSSALPATSPHARAANAAAQAPVPQASVMPAPRSCTRIVIAVASGPGSTISRFTCGNLATEVEQVDDAHLVDAHHAVRVAQAEVHHRTIGMAAER